MRYIFGNSSWLWKQNQFWKEVFISSFYELTEEGKFEQHLNMKK